MEIKKNSILNVNSTLFKVYGESKLYWLVHPLELIDKFSIDESIMLQTVENVTYKRFSSTVDVDAKVKFCKSKLYKSNLINVVDDVSNYYYYYGYNKTFKAKDKEKFIYGKNLLSLILSCTNGIVERDTRPSIRAKVAQMENDM